MDNNNNAHPVELMILAGWLVVEALAVLLVGAVALIVALLHATAQAAPPAPPAPVPSQPPANAPLAAPAALVALELGRSNVRQLRRLARAAGLPPSLSRSGRRSALLDALSGLEVALI